MTGRDQIVIRRSVWATSVALIPGLILGGFGLYVTIRPFVSGPGLYEGLMCITIGAVWLFFCLREMGDRRPYIVIDSLGLRVLQISMQNIPWHEMKSVKLVSTKRGSSLQIEVDNPDKYFPARHGYTKIDRWIDQKFRTKALYVGVSDMEIPAKEILELVRTRIEIETTLPRKD